MCLLSILLRTNDSTLGSILLAICLTLMFIIGTGFGFPPLWLGRDTGSIRPPARDSLQVLKGEEEAQTRGDGLKNSSVPWI